MQHFRKLMLLLQHESQSKQSSRSNASDRPSPNCLHVRNLLCLEEDLLDRICSTGMSKACFCWFCSLVALFCEWIFSPGACLHVSQAAHCTHITGPILRAPEMCHSVMCQPVSGCVAMSVVSLDCLQVYEPECDWLLGNLPIFSRITMNARFSKLIELKLSFSQWLLISSKI